MKPDELRNRIHDELGLPAPEIETGVTIRRGCTTFGCEYGWNGSESDLPLEWRFCPMCGVFQDSNPARKHQFQRQNLVKCGKRGQIMTYEEKRSEMEALLDNWGLYFEPGGSLSTGTGDGAGPTLSSMATSPSVLELIRVMELCRRMAPNHYKHLIGHYDAPFRLVQAAIKRRDARGRLVDDEQRIRQRVVPAWVTPRLVDRGVDFLIGTWRYPDRRCEACRESWEWDNLACRDHVRLELPLALRMARKAKLREIVDPVTGKPVWTMAA